MILVDANILIYSHVASFEQHHHAHEWLDHQLNGSARVGLPWESLLAFLRLVTNPRVFERPEPTAVAWLQVQAWLACERVWIPQPTERHADLLKEFLILPGVQANLIPDAHWLRSPWSTGLPCAQPIAILLDFHHCVGSTRSQAKLALILASPD